MKLRQSLLGPAALAVLGLVLLLGTADTAHADFNLELDITVEDPTAGANSDVTLSFTLPAENVQFAAIVQFIPPEWGVTPGDDMQIGAVVGELEAQATLGLINAPCNSALPVQFTMLNASIDINDTVNFLDDDDNGTQDVFEDKDDSSLMDGIEKYPDFITRTLTDENDQALQPVRRSAGVTIVAGISILLQFLIFEPGTFIDEEIANDADLGWPTVTLLQNAGDPDFDPVPGPITDFCTPLTTTNVSFGITKDNPCTIADPEPICAVSTGGVLENVGPTEPDEGGVLLFTNPEEGTYTFTTIGAGQRDADGDGIENSLDTCAFTPNEGDPREKGDGDFDEDGLDAACDPNDNEINSDEDLDGFLNRQDNCPLEANGELEDNQRDTDNDAIGDACDPNPEDGDTEGELEFATVSSEVTIGPGVGGGPSEDGGDDGDGGGSAVIIIVVVIAAVVVVGGGAFLFMRRGGGTPV